jgi:hypothetical protein
MNNSVSKPTANDDITNLAGGGSAGDLYGTMQSEFNAKALRSKVANRQREFSVRPNGHAVLTNW